MAVVTPQSEVVPIIGPVALGFLVIDIPEVALVPQLFFAATVIVPIKVPADTVIVIESPYDRYPSCATVVLGVVVIGGVLLPDPANGVHVQI